MPVIPMFPLGAVLLPGEPLSLQVFESRYVALVEDMLAQRIPREFGVVLIARGREVGGDDERTDVGVRARVDAVIPLPRNRFGISCTGGERFRVTRWLPDEPYPRADMQTWPDSPGAVDDTAFDDVAGKVTRLRELAAELSARSGIRPPEPVSFDDLPTDPTSRTYALAARLPLADADRQSVLCAPDAAQRLARIDDAVDDLTAVIRFRLS